MRKFFCIALAAAALVGCVGAPVTQTTHSFCASVPAARLLEDIALAKAERKPTADELAAIELARAATDARCAAAAAAATASAGTK